MIVTRVALEAEDCDFLGLVKLVIGVLFHIVLRLIKHYAIVDALVELFVRIISFHIRLSIRTTLF
jgi:hypothetical protein